MRSVAIGIEICHLPRLGECQSVRTRVSVAGFFLDVTAKLKAEGGQNFPGEIIFPARREALIKRCAEYGRRSCGLDCGEDRPAAFAGIGDTA